MIVKIPLFAANNSTSAVTAALGSITSPTGNAEQGRILRAVAAAAALLDPKEAMQLVKKGKDGPAELFVFDDQKAAALSGVVSALRKARTQPSNDKPATALEAAAKAVEADPNLSLTASQNLKGDAQGIKAALAWVAAVDPALLERAARAGFRLQVLDAVVTEPGERIDQVDTRVTEVVSEVKKLEVRVTALEGEATSG